MWIANHESSISLSLLGDIDSGIMDVDLIQVIGTTAILIKLFGIRATFKFSTEGCSINCIPKANWIYLYIVLNCLPKIC